MAGSKSNKEAKDQSHRISSEARTSSSRSSKAAGGIGLRTGRLRIEAQRIQKAQVEQRSNSSRQGARSQSASSKPAQRGRGAQGTTKAASSRRPAGVSPLSPTANDPRDTKFIKWAQDKWNSLEPHHQQSIFGFLLLALSLLLFSSLTIFSTAPIWSSINKFFITFFGWSAYLLALGLVAFSLAHFLEGIRRQRFIRWSMAIGLGVIWLLLLLESRLIAGHMAVGVLAELLVQPFLGWPPAVGHIIVLGLIIIITVITFRITFGHVLMVVGFIQRLLATAPRPTISTATSPSETSSYLGQRPRFSRYMHSAETIAVGENPPPVARRSGRRSAPVQIEEDDIAELLDDETDIEFEPDFEEEDPLNDINIHQSKVSRVPKGSRTAPPPLDQVEHSRAVKGASQQSLPFDAKNEGKIILHQPVEMEPLAPNPRRGGSKKTQAASAAQQPNIQSIWNLPDIALLHSPEDIKQQMRGDDVTALARIIQETLRSFRVDAEVRAEDVSIGPTVIRFGIRPTGKPEMMLDEKTGKMIPVRDAAGNIIYEVRTRVSRIMALQNDLALVLEAKTIRMEAPVPGRPYVGVEIPNKNSRLVTMREILESKEYQAAKAKSKLAVVLGRDVAGQVRVADLSRMPHLLIAGATGAGKCLAYDEPVFLADGRIVKVQELIGQSAQVIGVTDTQTMQQTPVPATFTENGVQKVFEIELDNGVILRRTGEHPLWAARLDENQHVGRQSDGKAKRRTRAIDAGWVHAKDLRVCGTRPNFDGHVILCPVELNQQGTVSKSDADVILCASLLAEGGLNNTGRANLSRRSLGTPRFTNADPLMVAQVAGAAKEYGCQLVLSPHKVKGDVDYYISQVPRGTRNAQNPVAQLVCDWKMNCLATQKRIPDWVFQLPNEQIALFLQVFIDCDGWFDATADRTCAVNITLANPILIQQIGQLALRLGITGSYLYSDNGYAGRWTWSSRMVTEWQERVGSIVKAEKLANAVREQNRQRKSAATQWNEWRRAVPLPDQKFSDCPQGYEWRKIVAIRRTVAPTVNIEVHSENHAFVGYAVEHNSVMINTIIASIIMQATPDDVRMLMVDPKMVELSMYNGIPHLLSPVVIEVDKVVSLLKNGINEMERRYRLFSQLGVRNLDGYRKLRLEKIGKGDTSLNNLPSIVIIIDELADLMMAAPEEVEGMICRLAQLARATGIHLVIATQRPSVDVITGLIKANIPTRISFMVSSAVDSRTIIDMGGAERLLGRGDMLYLPADAGRPERVQAAFLSDDEATALADYWRQQTAEHNQSLDPDDATQPSIEPGWELKEMPSDDFELDDELLDKAEEIVREYGRASISLLQRRLRIGYSRAARLIDLLEEHGIIGQFEPGGKPRQVLDSNSGYGQDNEGESMSDVAEEIAREEQERNKYLREQATRHQQQRNQQPPDDDDYGDDDGEDEDFDDGIYVER